MRLRTIILGIVAMTAVVIYSFMINVHFFGSVVEVYTGWKAYVISFMVTLLAIAGWGTITWNVVNHSRTSIFSWLVVGIGVGLAFWGTADMTWHNGLIGKFVAIATPIMMVSGGGMLTTEIEKHQLPEEQEQQ